MIDFSIIFVPLCEEGDYWVEEEDEEKKEDKYFLRSDLNTVLLCRRLFHLDIGILPWVSDSGLYTAQGILP